LASTSPARIDDDLFASAKVVADVSSRSAAQQVNHWARIGRELEASGTVSVREIAEVLAGARSYDELGPKEQAVVRAEWAERIDARRESLDLATVFAGSGQAWSELDADGNVVRHPPTSEPSAGKASAKEKVAVKQKAAAAKKPPAKKAARAGR
jgi:hypothetical protein